MCICAMYVSWKHKIFSCKVFLKNLYEPCPVDLSYLLLGALILASQESVVEGSSVRITMDIAVLVGESCATSFCQPFLALLSC